MVTELLTVPNIAKKLGAPQEAIRTVLVEMAAQPQVIVGNVPCYGPDVVAALPAAIKKHDADVLAAQRARMAAINAKAKTKVVAAPPPRDATAHHGSNHGRVQRSRVQLPLRQAGARQRASAAGNRSDTFQGVSTVSRHGSADEVIQRVGDRAWRGIITHGRHASKRDA